MTRYGATATRWYATREAVKRACGVSGSDFDSLIDGYIESASADAERATRHRFIPETDTKFYEWPQRRSYGGSSRFYIGTILWLADEDLLALSTLEAKSQDAAPVTIPAADYFLEPNNLGPPYARIEIDLSSSSAFEAGGSPQRSISVAGRWGFCEETRAAGTLAAAISTTGATSCACSDSSLIGVGDTLLIESEALFVSEKALVDTTANVNLDLASDNAVTTVQLDDATKVHAGEIITVGSERMLIESISGNNLTVKRAYDGSTLAAHSQPVDVYAPRTLTIVRGVNGTTAATHALSTAIAKYAPPGDVALYCMAKAILSLKQGESGWTGQIGGGEAGVTVNPWSVSKMRQELKEKYVRVSI